MSVVALTTFILRSQWMLSHATRTLPGPARYNGRAESGSERLPVGQRMTASGKHFIKYMLYKQYVMTLIYLFTLS
jgi:hypothetical protein